MAKAGRVQVLAVLLWPAGIALLCCLGAVLARRGQHSPVAGQAAPAPNRPEPTGGSGAPAAPGERRGWAQVARARAGNAGAQAGNLRAQAGNLLRFLLLVAAGLAVIYAVMVALAWLAEHFGPAIDRPILHWTTSHQVPAWKHVMEVATQVGDKYPTAIVAVIAAIALAATWHGDRWLPVVALISLVLIAHYLTFAIHLVIHRSPPPGSHGTFPSGGAARAVAVYGLVAYLAWRGFSGGRKVAVWLTVAVAVLSFNEAYSRGYLAVHWFTDILGGLVYGCLLLALYIAAVRAVAGPVPAGWAQESARPPPAAPSRGGAPLRARR
jgi:membrane-associated phospholipid phosphatase